MTSSPTLQLDRARALELPSRDEMLRRDPSVQHFWQTNRALLEQAWDEWERADGADLATLDESLIAPGLRAAVAGANTAKEALELTAGLALADRVAAQARAVALDKVAPETAVEILIFDRDGQLVGRAGG